jgi:hypothetical protein
VTYLPLFCSGFLSSRQFSRLPGEQRPQQRNNVVRSSFVLGTPGFILGSPRKLIIHLALLVDSGYAISLILFPNNLSSPFFCSGLIIPRQLNLLSSEQRNNVVRSSFVLGTPGFIFGSPRKLVVNPAFFVDSGCAGFLYSFSQ